MIPRSDPEFVGWPQLMDNVTARERPGVTLNLWGGRNAPVSPANPALPE